MPFDPDEFLSAPVIEPGSLRPTTYGPGSPNPTPADKREFVGHADNALQVGDAALQPETAAKYGLKTGDPFIYEGKTYHYADTPAAKVGDVIDVYHPGKFDPDAFLKGPTTTVTLRGTEPIKGQFDPTAFLEAPTEDILQPEQEQPARVSPTPQPSRRPEPDFSISIPQFQRIEIGTGEGSQLGQLIPAPQQPQPAGPPGPVGPTPPPPPPSGFDELLDAPFIPQQTARTAVEATLGIASQVSPTLAANLNALQRIAPGLEQGVVDSAADIVSGATTLRSALSVPAFLVPGVAEAYGAGVIAHSPQRFRDIKATIDRTGLGSRESTRELTNEAARLSTAMLPIFGRWFGGRQAQAAQNASHAAQVQASGPLPSNVPSVAQSVPQSMARRSITKLIAQKHSGVRNMADMTARQLANNLRQDFASANNATLESALKEGSPTNMDLQAASLIEEANGILSNLQKDAALIKSSNNKGLAKKYGAIADYAIENFKRISGIQNRYQQLMKDQMAEDAAAGIKYKTQQNYVTHVLKTQPNNTLFGMFTSGGSGAGGFTKYFAKRRQFNTLAEAIHEGFDPKSINLADLAQHRIAASKRLILQKSLFQELKQIRAKDGQPVLASTQRSGELVQRIEEPGVGRASVDKPHGVYTTPGDIESPHADLGGKQYLWRLNPFAKVLNVTESQPLPIRKMASDSGAGVHAAAMLLPRELAASIKQGMTKSEAIGIAKTQYPETNFSKYYDAQEVLEGLGGKLARDKGYDIIKQDDLYDPSFSERVLLTDKAAKPVSDASSSTGPPSGYEHLNLNGVDVAVHPDYSGIFKAMYGDSALRRGKIGRAVMKSVGLSKAYTLALDTFHGFRGIQKGLFYGKGKGAKGMGRFGFDRALTVYELNNEGLRQAVKSGELTSREAAMARSARPVISGLIENGLNVGGYVDNIVGQMHFYFPGTKGANDLIFKRIFRGSMMQAAYANYFRNKSRFPELSEQQVLSKTATEMNEVFGNLAEESVIKDKTVRDAANLVILAPQWVESQVRSEFRGYGQLAKVPLDLLRGKARIGTVAQGQATAVLAYLVGNQIINYATTGHSTFENPEGHKLMAYLPIGRGLYLDPFSLNAEYMDRFFKVMNRQGDNATIASVVSEMVRSKLSAPGRAAAALATQRDYRGRRLEGKQVYTSAASELVPVPIAAGSVLQRDPTAPLGFTPGFSSDKFMQQLIQGMGLRAEIDYPEAMSRLLTPQTSSRIRTISGGNAIGRIRVK